MSLEAGATLSHYRLISKIGEGGMGVVWKALDTTLDREIAIKVLPEAFGSDPERLARLEREAKLLGSLNHPNIAVVHGLHPSTRVAGSEQAVTFITMELVPGEDLAQRLSRGPLPVDEALELARQMANALEAAHERGVIHRDLKPANIKVGDNDTVKVLDFGLAKAVEPEAGTQEAASLPTVTSGGTLAGTILGTAAYMSPEQARGKPVDRRTDIWSFGCVLYEMLTGKKCFDGETPSDTLARIIEREPDWAALPAETPAEIRTLLRRCLRKDPRRRLRDIGEARVAIEDLGTAESAELTTDTPRSWRASFPWAIAAVMTICAAVLGWVNWRSEPAEQSASARLVVSLPPQQRLAIAGMTSVELSPDGKWLVYAASSPPGSRPRLYLRRLDRFEAEPIAGTEGAVGPFFSPDSRWMGYFANDKLLKISVEGGVPVEICHVGQIVPGASWGPDDSILFTDSPESGLLRVSAQGGTPELLTTPDYATGEIGHGWPQWSADGQSVLFSISTVQGPRIAVLSLATGTWQTLDKGIGGARYVPSGHLVFGLPEGLAAVPFDPVAMRTVGAPVVLQNDVYIVPGVKGFGVAAFTVSDTGILAFLPGGALAGMNRLVWVDRDGRSRPATEEPGLYEWPRLSPDGSKLAVNNRSADGQIGIWVIDLERDARSRLTLEGTGSITPTWTPDGSRIVFASSRAGSGFPSIFSRSADGSGEAQRLLGGEHPRFPRSWSPDGRLLVFTEWNPETMRDVWLLPLDDSGEPVPIINTRFDEHSPILSPDGRWLAYVSDESGRNEVYVQSHPAGSGRWIISAGGGNEPVWSADGRTLFYRIEDAMMEVPIKTVPSFKAGRPRVVFRRALKEGIYESLSYDVSADGQRFLMIERDLEAAPNQINVVLDWGEELRRRVPVDAE